MAKIAGLYGLIIIIPSLALSVRRLHDTNRSGWWILINFIPLIGALIYLYFMVQSSVSENNIYGDESQILAPQLTQ